MRSRSDFCFLPFLGFGPRTKGGVAQADAIRAAIAKKNIQAPFAAHLGIRLVNLGQIPSEGEPIVRETSSKDRTHESAADTI